MDELTKKALERVKGLWPYLGHEMSIKVARLMVAFHRDMMDDQPEPAPENIEPGQSLLDFFEQYDIGRGYRKEFRVMFRIWVANGEIKAWKNNRKWMIGSGQAEKLWLLWESNRG